MIKLVKDYVGVYYLLFFFSCLSIYFYPPVVPIFSVIILFTSYYLIIVRQRFDVVIALIFYSRSLNGFIFLHDKTAFLVVNLLTNALPILLYFFIVMSKGGFSIKKNTFLQYKYTILFFLLLTAGFVINFATSYDVISRRYVPLALFVFFLLAFTRIDDFNVDGILRFFRSVFIASIIVFFFSDYLSITRDLMESDSVFGVTSPPNSFNLVFFSFTRNVGPAFDHRILAIMAYLFLLMSIVHKSKYLKWDIIISIIIVVSSLSRGAILTYAFILAVYWIKTRGLHMASVVTWVSIIVCALSLFSTNLINNSTQEYVQSFNPGSANNALEQRAAFANYAMDAFSVNPVFGSGVGALTSNLIERTIVVDGATIKVIGDAFWFILLAEMGIVGGLLYFLFLKEIFLVKNLLFVALFAGFLIQLLGTDIPDMRSFYFAFLVLVFMAKHAWLENSQSLKKEFVELS